MLVLLTRLWRTDHRRHALELLAGAVAVVIAGGAVFAATQHLPVTTGWYWAVTTATTVGYGDVTPHNASGRLVASVVMLTAIPMVAAAFALTTGSAVASRLRRLLRMDVELPRKPFRLVLGAGAAISTVLEELRRAGGEVVLVADTDDERLPPGIRLVRGDPTDAALLARVEPGRATDALIWPDSDGDALVTAVLLREAAPQLPIVAVVHSRTVGQALRELGVSEVVTADELVAHAVAKTLEAPHAGELVIRLLASDEHRLVEEQVAPESPARPLSAVRDQRDELVLGVVSDGSMSLGVGDDPTVRPGDTLLVVAPLARASGRRHV